MCVFCGGGRFGIRSDGAADAVHDSLVRGPIQLGDIPADDTTTATVSVGGSFTDQLEVAGDRDWIAVTLTAGQAYDIALNGTGTNALNDPLVRIYDDAGNLLDFDDDGGPGLNALIAGFVATYTGTFYIEAASFLDGGAGRYKLKVDGVAAPTPPDFLESIDWGSEVSTNVIDVYFAQAGETFDGETSLGWNAYEIQQAMLAFQQIANVCDVTFNVTNNAAGAEFNLVTVNSNSFLGYFNPPGTNNEGVGVFARNGRGWDQNDPGTGGLEKGGYGFVTLIHEFGHGMGLAHPHDGGGRSEVWEGVTGPFGSFGTFDLNQGIYTTMSYNDGWQLQPGGQDNQDGYGWQGTMMAFDIALLQEKYGANTSFAGGNDIYVLPDTAGVGTFFSCIWDTGGTDAITYGGTEDATIDLRPAHLGYAPGSGGFISFVDRVNGGFTIANGVVIENATGGGGRDRITGSDVRNVLGGGGRADDILGGDGDDVIRGSGGKDTIAGEAGRDRMTGGGGGDSFVFASHLDSGTGGAADEITDFASGQDRIDLAAIDARTGGGADDDFLFIDQAAFSGTEGELRWDVQGGDVVIEADRDGNGVSDFAILLTGIGAIVAGDILA